MIIRKPGFNDAGALCQFYQEVARCEGGIARIEEEITLEYIREIMEASNTNGLMLMGVEPATGSVIAEIHASKYGIKIFDHILTNLTIVVHTSKLLAASNGEPLAS